MNLTGSSDFTGIVSPSSLYLKGTPELTISLKENQKITVKVAAVSGNNVALNYNGKIILAKSTVPLQPGSTLTVEVHQSRAELITLSLLSSQSPQTPQTIEDSITNLIKLVGLKDASLSRNLVKEALESGISIEEEQMKEALNLAAQMEEEPLATKGLIFMMRHSLPLNPEILKRITAFLKESGGTETSLKNLTNTVKDFMARLQSYMPETLHISETIATAKTIDMEEQKSIKEQLSSLLKALTLVKDLGLKTNILNTSNISINDLALEVEKLVKEKTASIEARFFMITKDEISFFLMFEELIKSEAIKENNNLPPILNATLKNLEEEIASLLKNEKELPDLKAYILNRIKELSNFHENSQIETNQTYKELLKLAEKLTHMHRNIAVMASELRPILNFIEANLASLDRHNLPPLAYQAISNLSNSIGQALLAAEGEELVNLGMSKDPTETKLIISLPLRSFEDDSKDSAFSSTFQQGELRIYSREDSSGNPINPKDVTLAFLLNTKNLGKLSLVISIKEDNVSGNFAVEKEDIKKFLEEHIPFLQERLEGLSFKVGTLAVNVEKITYPPLVTKSISLEGITKIDIKV